MIVYICGPITGKANNNTEAFSEAESFLVREGFDVRNPLNHGEGSKTHTRSFYMSAGVGAINGSNAIVLLDGWKNSDGCLLEVMYARERMLEFYRIEKHGETETVFNLIRPVELMKQIAEAMTSFIERHGIPVERVEVDGSQKEERKYLSAFTKA